MSCNFFTESYSGPVELLKAELLSKSVSTLSVIEVCIEQFLIEGIEELYRTVLNAKSATDLRK